jgi:hypothetical protein
MEQVELATLEWVDWFNNRQLFEPIGNIPRVEYEALYYQQQETPAIVADSINLVSGKTGAVQINKSVPRYPLILIS